MPTPSGAVRLVQRLLAAALTAAAGAAVLSLAPVMRTHPLPDASSPVVQLGPQRTLSQAPDQGSPLIRAAR